MPVIFYLLQSSLKSSISNKAQFFIRATLMALNTMIFLIIWRILFSKYGSVGGWGFDDFLLMYGITSFCFGFNSLFFDGLRQIPFLIDSGQFDRFFAYPQNVLITSSCSSSDPSGFGDIIASIILISLSGFFFAHNFWIIILALICGTIFFYSVLMLTSSIAFFVSGSNDLIKLLLINTFILSSNVPTIYSGIIKFIVFFCVPVVIMSYLPIMLIQKFTYCHLFYLIGGTAAFFSVSLWVFRQGIKRYKSGGRTTI